MKKVLIAAALLVLTLFILGVLHIFWMQYKSQQLWRIVSQQCVPHQQRQGEPEPCLAVNEADHYAVFNDRNGPLHTLLLPTQEISGIESPLIVAANAENYFLSAWENRRFLKQRAAFEVKDDYLALAVNSRFGRTQNQLHIHLACLKKAPYQAIQQYAHQIGDDWQPLPGPIQGQAYIAIKASRQQNPVLLLSNYVKKHGDSMQRYGLISLPADNDRVILLASRAQFMPLNLASTESLLDVHCALAGGSQP